MSHRSLSVGELPSLEPKGKWALEYFNAQLNKTRNIDELKLPPTVELP